MLSGVETIHEEMKSLIQQCQTQHEKHNKNIQQFFTHFDILSADMLFKKYQCSLEIQLLIIDAQNYRSNTAASLQIVQMALENLCEKLKILNCDTLNTLIQGPDYKVDIVELGERQSKYDEDTKTINKTINVLRLLNHESLIIGQYSVLKLLKENIEQLSKEIESKTEEERFLIACIETIGIAKKTIKVLTPYEIKLNQLSLLLETTPLQDNLQNELREDGDSSSEEPLPNELQELITERCGSSPKKEQANISDGSGSDWDNESNEEKNSAKKPPPYIPQFRLAQSNAPTNNAAVDPLVNTDTITRTNDLSGNNCTF